MDIAELRNGIIDVTELGIKNDGSEDVSKIVNVASKDHALYFPPGRYRVSNTLQLKHSIYGKGFSRAPDRSGRIPEPDNTRTWFISDIDCDDHSASIVEFGEQRNINIEEINIMCKSGENAIRVLPCAPGCYAFISKIGIYSLGGTGISIECQGSRAVFVQDICMWGSCAKYWDGSCGVRVNAWDCRLSNIEVMAAQIGVEISAGYTYGENLHLWTGCMAKGSDKAEWWKKTRGILMRGRSHLVGSNIYPDTCYHPVEFETDSCLLDIRGIMYWDDASERGCEDHGGSFLKCPKGAEAGLSIDGGYWGVCGSDDDPHWMSKLYTPGANIRRVIIRSEMSISGKNIDTLCFGQDLPDYEVTYDASGWCKIADVFTVADSGSCAATFSLEDGAAWELTFTKENGGVTELHATALNKICGAREFKTIEADGVMKVFISSNGTFTGRFVTTRMCRRFRPVDYRHLLTHAGNSRLCETIQYNI